MRNPSPVGAVKKGSPAPSPLYVNTWHILLGNDLADAGRKCIVVEDGLIVDVMDKWVADPDFTVDAVIPLPVNAHTHLSDLRIPEACWGYSLSGYAGSRGLKHPLIKLFREPLFTPQSILELSILMGVGDYQELSDTCPRYREALSGTATYYVGLSRPSNWWGIEPGELWGIVHRCGGIGISNPTRLPSWVLEELAEVSREYIVSAHVSETPWMEETGGLHYLLDHHIHLQHIVHGVFLADWELRLLAEEDVVLVSNPRSNIWFTGKITDLDRLIQYGGIYALGTDNAGCFGLNIFEEAELLYTLRRGGDPRKIVEALTLNGARALGFEPVIIDVGGPAYFLGLDLGLPDGRTWNIYASIARRSASSSRMVVFKKDTAYIIDKVFRRAY